MGLGLSFRHRLQHVRRGWPIGAARQATREEHHQWAVPPVPSSGAFDWGRIFEPLDRNKPIMPDLRTFTKLLAFHAILNYSYFMLSSSSHHTPDTWRSNPMTGRIFLGRYEAVRLLGEGGMGKVYLARQLDLGRQVVIKVMHDHIAADPKFRERFQRETLLMARFQHPYAVTLYDASINDQSGPCIVMEYVRGVNMEVLLQKNRRLSPGRVGRLVTQLCEVLQAAHELGMIHRDLKPSNLMVVDHDSPREKVKVMDFGLAKLIEPEPGMAQVTESNFDFAVGTPGYICPEQVRGEAVDHRSDLYSVGVILYELLTGRLPFLGPTSMDLMLAHATEMPPSFADLELDEFISPSVEQVVFQTLAKCPEDRPQSARELIELYDTALSIDQMGPMVEPVEEAEIVQAPTLIAHDPSTFSFQMEAWMPESIAIMKLRGFAYDMGGEVTEKRTRVDQTAPGCSCGNAR